MSHKPNFGKPKPPPFKVGTRLRYRGERRAYVGAVPNPRDIGKHPEDWQMCIGPGLEVTIIRVEVGHQGTGRHLRDEDGPMYDDEGEPYLDETRDGYSVYEVPTHNRMGGRCIDHKSKRDWEVLTSGPAFDGITQRQREIVLDVARGAPRWHRARSSGERVTLASLWRKGILDRRAWRGVEGAADAAHEYRLSSRFAGAALAALGEPS